MPKLAPGLAAEAELYANAGAKWALEKHGVKPKRFFPWKPKAKRESPTRCPHCNQWFERASCLRRHSQESWCARKQAKLQTQRSRKKPEPITKPVRRAPDPYARILGKPKNWSLAHALMQQQG